MQAWVALFQFVSSLLLFPLNIIPNFGQLTIQEIPQNMLDALRCFVNLPTSNAADHGLKKQFSIVYFALYHTQKHQTWCVLLVWTLRRSNNTATAKYLFASAIFYSGFWYKVSTPLWSRDGVFCNNRKNIFQKNDGPNAKVQLDIFLLGARREISHNIFLRYPYFLTLFITAAAVPFYFITLAIKTYQYRRKGDNIYKYLAVSVQGEETLTVAISGPKPAEASLIMSIKRYTHAHKFPKLKLALSMSLSLLRYLRFTASQTDSYVIQWDFWILVHLFWWFLEDTALRDPFRLCCLREWFQLCLYWAWSLWRQDILGTNIWDLSWCLVR